jgi:hypothetical protein
MTLIYRLHSLLKREYDALKGIPEKSRHVVLGKRVEKANVNADPKGKIDSRTLERLALDPEGVQLTQNNLIALHNYFTTLGEPLHLRPIFEKKGVLHCMAESEKIIFLLGAKPGHDERNDISGWDVLCMAELLAKLGAHKAQLKDEIVTVFLDLEATLAGVEKEDWYTSLAKPNHTFVAVGSPKASNAAEVMLATMMGVMPFQPPDLDYGIKNSLPFVFAWNLKGAQNFKSHCAVSAAQLKEFRKHYDWARQVSQDEGSAYFFNEKWNYIPHRSPTNQWAMFGSLVIQRRDTTIWAVISGISGPATLAVARKIHEIEHALPVVKGGNSPVLIVPVLATVTDEHKAGASRLKKKKGRPAGDTRRPGRIEFLGPVILRDPAAPSTPGT